MSPTFFADLHCHPTLFAFNRLRNGAREQDPAQFHPWAVPPSNLARQERGGRATDYSQCDFDKLTRGRARLVHASITPIETGFFEGSVDPREHHPFGIELVRLLSGVTAATAAFRFAREGSDGALRELTKILRNRGPLRRLLQIAFLKYSPARVRHLLSRDYDYWDELLREYDFLLSWDGVRCEADGPGTGSGRYELIRSPDHMNSVLEADDDTICAVLSIEGGHVFSIAGDETVDDAVIFERIEELKRWPHPFLFITPAHHFDNGFCGHARSLPSIGGMIMDQTPRMHTGFEEKRDLGRRVFRALLDVDDELNDLGSRRILLDCKHMSPLLRKQYYAEFVIPYNAKRDRTRPPIPVIHSHTGYSAVARIDDLIRHQDDEHDHWHVDNFRAWGLNACDEDVHMVHDTEGLIGVCFDQGVAGVGPNERVPEQHYGRVLVRQILAMADVILQDDRRDEEDRIRVWDRICIGSDFDGVIHPVASHSTALSFPAFAEDLRVVLNEKRHTRFIERVGVDEIVERVCWKNIFEFTQRHLGTAE